MLRNYWALTKQLFHSGGPVAVKRSRLTPGEINSGTILVPAVTNGYEIRFTGCKVIAIGGAVGGATSIVITGWRNQTKVNLVTIAVAALTQSAVVRDGQTDSVVLPDGASYFTLDRGKPIMAEKVGGNVTGATNVDFLIEFTSYPN